MPNAKILSDIELWSAIVTKKNSNGFLILFPLLFFSFFYIIRNFFLTYWKFLCLTNLLFNWQYTVLRLPGPIYMPIGYVLELRFSAGMI